mmetsp:Transcript_13831/g.44489  ORF Transcript_13831/g.44489 Transcript_13831/m.44489 type:complete len:226 (-) Transcript_13831:268-945(-)
MSILPIFGCTRSFILPLSFFAFSFSITDARIFSIPVAAMNSGSAKGGFSTPRFPCRNFRFCDQCRGTGTVLRSDLRLTRRRGSAEVTSHGSITSGLLTSCLSSAIERRFSRRFAFFPTSLAASPPPSSSSAAAASSFSFASLFALSSSLSSFSASACGRNRANTSAISLSSSVPKSSASGACGTYSTCIPASSSLAALPAPPSAAASPLPAAASEEAPPAIIAIR